MGRIEPMNHLERFRALMDFQPVDRIPRIEWATWWDQTIDRWCGEGLGVRDRYELYEVFDLDPYFQWWFSPRARTFPRPGRHGGAVIRTMAEYRALLPHLYPSIEPALAAIEPWAGRQARGEAVVWISLDGFFWFPRTLLGIEGHFYAFYDQPELMHRINQDLANYNTTVLEQLSRVCRPAFMTFGEDMSYNHGPMLSKDLFDEFLAPYYRQVIPMLRQMGTRVLIDSDGDVTEMIPWLLGVGIEGVLPLERQAGVDAARLRRIAPRLLMIGHYDKMVMTRGEAAMRAEFERLLPVMRQGGFIPSVDHQTPPGVSLAEYRVYLGLLEEYTESAAT
jgi:hypothetical protein